MAQIDKSRLNGFIDKISKLLEGEIIKDNKAIAFLSSAKKRLEAVRCLAVDGFSANDIESNLTTCCNSLPEEEPLKKMSDYDKVSACEDFYNSVKEFTDSIISNSNEAVNKKKQTKRKFLAVGIIGEVLELIVSLISISIDANWFGWAVVGIRATQVICLFLSLFSVIAFCFDVVPDVVPANNGGDPEIKFKTEILKKVKADHTNLIFISFMLITLLIGVALIFFTIKGLPLSAPLILLGFAIIVLISFLVMVKIRTKGKKENSSGETNNIDVNGNNNKVNVIKKITSTPLVIFIVLFFAVSILFGVFSINPQFLYGTSTITYKIDDVTQTKSVVYTKEYSIEVPEKTGYTFLGLYDKEENGIQYIDEKGVCVKSWDSKIRDENKILYAQWKINSYIFVYDTNGGEGQGLHNFECKYEANLPTLASNISKRGYTFLGWAISENKDAKLLSDCNGNLVIGKEKLTSPAYDIPTVETTIDLYAKWQAKTNEIIFDGNGAINGSMSNQQIATDQSDNLNANKYLKKGYTFAGWAETATGEVAFADKANYIMGTDSTYLLYAVWVAKKYEVTFDINGGVGEIAKVTATYDSAMPKLSSNAPTKIGYRFDGFYDKAVDGGIYYNADLTSVKIFDKTVDTTLYAVWIAEKYEVTFDINGGVGEIAKVTATYDSAMPKLSSNAPTKIGYTFDGFYDKAVGGEIYYYANLTSAKTFDKTVATTLYAVWVADDNTLTFSSNDGTGRTANQIIKTDATEKLYANNFKKIGFAFAGWAKTATGEVVFGDKASYTMAPGGATLYAIWVGEITFNANGGTGEMAKQIIRINETAQLTANTFIRDGYKFSGWAETATGEVVFGDKANYTMAIGGVTLYVVWTANTYTIQLDANGGNVGQSSKDVTFASSYTLPTPSMTGKTFQGWFTSISSGTKMTSNSGSSIKNWSGLAGITLYAQWTNTPYTITYDTAGGSDVSSKTCYYGEIVELPTTKRYKYDAFNGWTYNSTTYTTSFTMPANNVSMKAKFTTEYTYIKTKQDMENIKNNLSGKYMLFNDIYLGEWTPIGTYEFNKDSSPTKPFTGIFDGDNHTITYKISIKGTTINNNYAWGLFGSVFKATILNLNVSVSIYGDLNSGESTSPTAGGVAGWAKFSSFTNCTSSGSVTQDRNGSANYGCVRSGGIVGIAYSSTFTGCTNEASIMAGGLSASAAGIAGGADKPCQFINCLNKVTVEVNAQNQASGNLYTEI